MFNIQVFRKGNRGATSSSLVNNLVEWWNLSETSGNRVGSYAGTILTSINGVGNGAGVNGTIAAEFVAASSQELLTSSTSSLQMGDIDFSMCGWIYLISNNYGSILNKWETGIHEYILYYDPTITSFRFILDNGGTVDNVPSTTFGAATLNTWYFVYGEYDAATDLMKISVNGGALDSNSHAGGAQAAGASLSIGRLDASGYPNSRVQRAGIWKRKLTSTEIATLYNGGNGISYPFS